MKNRITLFLAIAIFTASCKSNIDDQNEAINKEIEIDTFYIKSNDLKYLTNPDSADVLCKDDVERAKSDLKKHHGVYVRTICFGCDFKPYEKEIEEILERKQFKLGIQEFGCVLFKGQTQGCYKGYIDIKMKQKYGEDYQTKIESEAEKLFIKNIDSKNRTISVFQLEQKDQPKLLNKDLKIDGGGNTTLGTQIPITQTSSSRIFLDLDFIVEKNGTLSNFSLNNWANNEVKENEKVKQELYEFAVKEFQTVYNKWKPGVYKNHLVRTEHTLRIYFN